jgi:hypothetical protein
MGRKPIRGELYLFTGWNHIDTILNWNNNNNNNNNKVVIRKVGNGEYCIVNDNLQSSHNIITVIVSRGYDKLDI